MCPYYGECSATRSFQNVKNGIFENIYVADEYINHKLDF